MSQVADAFDLANAVKATPQQALGTATKINAHATTAEIKAEGPAAVRMAALEREAGVVLHQIRSFSV